METVLLIAVALLLGLHGLREYWARRVLPRESQADFDGELFRVGASVIARRPPRGDSVRTLICFPGFLEDMRYFQALYADVDDELILVNNADYHSPFPADDAEVLDWPQNPYRVGTIEHDGFLVGQVLERLAGGARVVLHGHSRGGAVVLETGRQFPELTSTDERSVAAILEAPVLPRGRVAGRGSEPLPHALICYLLPPALGLLRKSSRERLLRQPMMRPTNELKTALCLSLYSNARRYGTCVTNARSIRRWQRERGHDLFANYRSITVVAGERDDVLDNASMLASAERGRELNPGVRIVRTTATNHFVSLERPECLRELLAAADPSDGLAAAGVSGALAPAGTHGSAAAQRS